MRGRDLPARNAALWFALLGGPAAWTTHLLASYPLVPLACDLQTTLPLNLLTAATALVSAAAATAGGLACRRLRGQGAVAAEAGDMTGPDGGITLDRARFMAGAGGVLGLFFVYVILVQGLPPLLQDPCLKAL